MAGIQFICSTWPDLCASVVPNPAASTDDRGAGRLPIWLSVHVLARSGHNLDHGVCPDIASPGLIETPEHPQAGSRLGRPLPGLSVRTTPCPPHWGAVPRRVAAVSGITAGTTRSCSCTRRKSSWYGELLARCNTNRRAVSTTHAATCSGFSRIVATCTAARSGLANATRRNACINTYAAELGGSRNRLATK